MGAGHKNILHLTEEKRALELFFLIFDGKIQKKLQSPKESGGRILQKRTS